MFLENFAMKKHLLILLAAVTFTACDKENFNNKNPYIPNYSFSEEINRNLPAYSALNFPSNAIYYGGGGVRGLIVFNSGGGGYKAYDAACPNQELSSCSTMTINGINAKCACDDVEYSLFTGQAQGMQYPMKEYRVEVVGSIIRVYN